MTTANEGGTGNLQDPLGGRAYIVHHLGFSTSVASPFPFRLQLSKLVTTYSS